MGPSFLGFLAFQGRSTAEGNRKCSPCSGGEASCDMSIKRGTDPSQKGQGMFLENLRFELQAEGREVNHTKGLSLGQTPKPVSAAWLDQV